MPFSYFNVGFVQAFPADNAECVCEGLKRIFEYIDGVPIRIVFDNATGVGCRICDVVRTTKPFGSFVAHYGFAFPFCNPNSGHEKGNVENKNKMGYIRRKLFVPVPQLSDMKNFNARLLRHGFEFSEKDHRIKGKQEAQLFMEDRFALMDLQQDPRRALRAQESRQAS
mgnify:CR=1 FL=1